MITALCVVLINSIISGPSHVISWVFYLLCTLPFFTDMLLSMNHAFRTLTEEPRTSTCTIEELTPANEENFLNAEFSSTRRQEDMYNPSDRIVPETIQRCEPLNNIVTAQWKDNAVDASKNSTMKQIIAAAMIVGYLYLGGSQVADSENTALGAVTLTYAASSLIGYFGMGDAPLARLARVNAVSAFCGIFGIISMISGGVTMPLLLLTMMMLFDTYQGAISETPATHQQNILNSEFERVDGENENRRDDGVLVNFFTESWKLNSYNKKNFETCQMV